MPSILGSGACPPRGAQYSDEGLYSLPLSEALSDSDEEEATGAGVGRASVGELVSEKREGAMLLSSWAFWNEC